MWLHEALAVSALCAAAVLFFSAPDRIFSGLALVAALLETALAFGLVRFGLHLPLGLVLGLALALPGLLGLFRATSKPAVSSASVVALIGALQALHASGLAGR